MAIYHLNIKPISRSKGHTVGDALAYETGVKLTTIEGKEADFTRKQGIEEFAVIGAQDNLQTLADKIELSERRKNSTLGRRFTIALPAELNKSDRWQAAQEFGQWLNEQYKVAVVVSMHAPDRGGDQRNHHAHITISDRRINEAGEFGEKARELTAAATARIELGRMRQQWEVIGNKALEKAGKKERISHQSNEARGIQKQPSIHLGRVTTNQIRKGLKNHKSLVNSVIHEQNERIPNQRSEGTNQQESELHPRRDAGDEQALGVPIEEILRAAIRDRIAKKEESKRKRESEAAACRREQAEEIFGDKEYRTKGKVEAAIQFIKLKILKIKKLAQSPITRDRCERADSYRTSNDHRAGRERGQAISSQRHRSSTRRSSVSSDRRQGELHKSNTAKRVRERSRSRGQGLGR